MRVYGGIKASTTGNTTGIYDISGGALERVAGYVNNGHRNLALYGESLLNAPSKHKQVYEAITSSNITATSGNDDIQKNYERMSAIFGDAIYETSNYYDSDSNSWNSDYSHCPYISVPFFGRGGPMDRSSNAGSFNFDYTGGQELSWASFRPTIVVY